MDGQKVAPPMILATLRRAVKQLSKLTLRVAVATIGMVRYRAHSDRDGNPLFSWGLSTSTTTREGRCA
jgi:hypothetical protein